MSDAPTQAAAVRFGWTRSPAVKLGWTLVLILLLQVPLYAVSSLIDERQERQEEVLTGIRRSWGPAQAVTGPTLAIPYSWVEPATNVTPAQTRRGWVSVPARQLAITAALAPETRQRGLFHATVYTADVAVEGSISLPAIELKDVQGAVLNWAGAVLALGSTDLRGQPPGGTMVLNGQPVPLTVQSNSGDCAAVMSTPAGFTGPVAPGTALTVQAHMKLRGTQSFAVLPWGQQIDMRVNAPWQTPSFTGAGLPLSYTIDKAGFNASWEVAGDATASNWRTGSGPLPGCAVADPDGQVGVDLLEAVPTYLMVTRAAKYGSLFLVLSFLTYFLIEQGTGLRIHLAQYALLGLSVSLFAPAAGGGGGAAWLHRGLRHQHGGGDGAGVALHAIHHAPGAPGGIVRRGAWGCCSRSCTWCCGWRAMPCWPERPPCSPPCPW